MISKVSLGQFRQVENAKVQDIKDFVTILSFELKNLLPMIAPVIKLWDTKWRNVASLAEHFPVTLILSATGDTRTYKGFHSRGLLCQFLILQRHFACTLQSKQSIKQMYLFHVDIVTTKWHQFILTSCDSYVLVNKEHIMLAFDLFNDTINLWDYIALNEK
jgi:hypothetical protein